MGEEKCCAAEEAEEKTADAEEKTADAEGKRRKVDSTFVEGLGID